VVALECDSASCCKTLSCLLGSAVPNLVWVVVFVLCEPQSATFATPCGGSFDHRLLPWFVAAVSGPKAVVIVLDASSLRVSSADFEVAKAAAATIVSGLSDSDVFSAVSFGNAASHFQSSLVAATSTNKQAFTAWIGSLASSSGSGFAAIGKWNLNAIRATFWQQLVTLHCFCVRFGSCRGSIVNITSLPASCRPAVSIFNVTCE
jgi:hypothetical protein